MERKSKITIVIIAVAIVLLVLFGVYSKTREIYLLLNSEGSAGTLDGTTVVVSIFANDTNSEWNETEDAEKITNINSYLSIACDYLEDVTRSYGKEALFIADFEEYADLKYEMNFSYSLTNQEVIDEGDVDYDVWEYIDDNIDTASIKSKYDADNLVFMLFIDSDKDNEAITCTRNYYTGMPYEYEIVYLYNIDYELVNCPAVYAHEILHTFGAPDLYVEDENYNITDEFLTYVEENMSNDIMLTCSDVDTYEYHYDSITNEVGEVTAYYVGLIDQSDIVDEWALLKP